MTRTPVRVWRMGEPVVEGRMSDFRTGVACEWCGAPRALRAGRPCERCAKRGARSPNTPRDVPAAAATAAS